MEEKESLMKSLAISSTIPEGSFNSYDADTNMEVDDDVAQQELGARKKVAMLASQGSPFEAKMQGIELDESEIRDIRKNCSSLEKTVKNLPEDFENIKGISMELLKKKKTTCDRALERKRIEKVTIITCLEVSQLILVDTAVPGSPNRLSGSGQSETCTGMQQTNINATCGDPQNFACNNGRDSLMDSLAVSSTTQEGNSNTYGADTNMEVDDVPQQELGARKKVAMLASQVSPFEAKMQGIELDESEFYDILKNCSELKKMIVMLPEDCENVKEILMDLLKKNITNCDRALERKHIEKVSMITTEVSQLSLMDTVPGRPSMQSDTCTGINDILTRLVNQQANMNACYGDPQNFACHNSRDSLLNSLAVSSTTPQGNCNIYDADTNMEVDDVPQIPEARKKVVMLRPQVSIYTEEMQILEQGDQAL